MAKGITRNRSGMTLLELAITAGIAAILLAMIVGLSRYANASVDRGRARADLAEWGDALHRWFVQFGEYPYATLLADGSLTEVNAFESPPSPEVRNNLSNLFERIYVEMQLDGSQTNLYFRSFLRRAPPLTDPWGGRYLYFYAPGQRSCTLFSTGPDQQSEVLGDDPATSMDDIFFVR